MKKKTQPRTPDYIRGFERAVTLFLTRMPWHRRERDLFNRVTRKLYGRKRK